MSYDSERTQRHGAVARSLGAFSGVALRSWHPCQGHTSGTTQRFGAISVSFCSSQTDRSIEILHAQIHEAVHSPDRPSPPPPFGFDPPSAHSTSRVSYSIRSVFGVVESPCLQLSDTLLIIANGCELVEIQFDLPPHLQPNPATMDLDLSGHISATTGPFQLIMVSFFSYRHLLSNATTSAPIGAFLRISGAPLLLPLSILDSTSSPYISADSSRIREIVGALECLCSQLSDAPTPMRTRFELVVLSSNLWGVCHPGSVP